MEERSGLTMGEQQRPRRRLDWQGGLRSIVLPLAVLAAILGGLWYWDNREEGGRVADDARFAEPLLVLVRLLVPPEGLERLEARLVELQQRALGVVELPAARNPTGRPPLAEVGRVGPDFLLERPEGGTLRLSDLQGRPVVLNFWAIWCPPCRAEIPELVDAYAAHRDEGLVVVGLNLQQPAAKVLAFALDFGMTFPIVIDRDGEVADVWRLGGPIKGLPTSYFIDRTGVIRAFYYGPMTEEALEKRLASILPGAGS